MAVGLFSPDRGRTSTSAEAPRAVWDNYIQDTGVVRAIGPEFFAPTARILLEESALCLESPYFRPRSRLYFRRSGEAMASSNSWVWWRERSSIPAWEWSATGCWKIEDPSRGARVWGLISARFAIARRSVAAPKPKWMLPRAIPDLARTEVVCACSPRSPPPSSKNLIIVRTLAILAIRADVLKNV